MPILCGFAPTPATEPMWEPERPHTVFLVLARLRQRLRQQHDWTDPLRRRANSISATPSAPARSRRSARSSTRWRKDIWPAVEARKLQLPIDQVYKFADIGKAFEHMEANMHLGKIVVTL